MAQNHSAEYAENPMTRDGRIQGPSRRYRRLRNPIFPAELWTEKNPLLQRGEIGFEIDTNKAKVGDGHTYWNDLPYSFTAETEWGYIVGDIEDQTDLKNALDGKQDVIADLATIRSDAAAGKTASETIATYGDIVTHNVSEFATAAQGAKADTAVQPGDLATVATTGDYDDLLNKPTIPAAQVNSDWNANSGVAEILNKPTIPTVNDATLTIQKNGTSVATFTANSATATTANITVPTTAADVNALPDSTKYTANVSMTLNSSTYVVTLQLKDQDGNNIGTAQTIDLPLESVVVSGSYDSATKEVVLTLQDGSTIRFSVADLVSGLQTEITVNNMLNADLVDDSTSTNKFVTSSDITTWNGKQDALTAGSNITISGTTISATDTTYTGSDGITLTGTNFTNSGVRSVATGSTNGTISVNTNGTSADVAVYGLGSAAYTASTSYATSAQGAKADTAVQPGDLATVATTGDYDDLLNKPTIPTVNDATLTIQKNGTNVATFTANASSGVTANISVPTDTNDLTNGAGYITGITSSDVTTALGYTPANNTDVVHKTGTETITGAKTFENTDSVSASLTALTLKGDNLHKGTNPSSNHFNSIEFTDDSDVNIAKFSAIQTSDGWTGFLAGAGSDPTAPQNNLLMIANGTSKLLLIPATSSHASCAVRRDFFNNNAVKHTPSTAVGSSTQPIYVASDGTATACSLATVASTGAYSDLSGTPTIPTVGNGTITITQGGISKGTFTTNQSGNTTIALDAGGSGEIKSIDAEIIGSLTVAENGDVSGTWGFYTGYLKHPCNLDFTGASSFEIVIVATTSYSSGAVFSLQNTESLNKGMYFDTENNKLHAVVGDGSNHQEITGTTSLTSNTKYYAKLTYDGTSYTLALSTDGISYTTEATAIAQYIPKYNNYETKLFLGSGGSILHVSQCYIKKDNILVWNGLDAPGLHQRVAKGHEVIEFQAPTALNNYTWYRKYADGWVEQGGIVGQQATSGTISINIPVEMANTYYTLVSGAIVGANGSTDHQEGANEYMSKSTTSFEKYIWLKWTSFWWKIEGMAA